jgi:3-phenylpropionate/trans-cinnamate dioxygenase ferredoxin reductase component
VVVVGAGLAGWRLCETLRTEGFTGELTLIGAEPHLPYDRPPLSKQVLSGKWPAERASLATEAQVTSAATTVRLGTPVIALDPERGALALGDGSEIVGTVVVVATGTRARELPFSASARLHTLRTVDDAERILASAQALAPGTTVAVIGGGFIGAEVATSLHALGLAPVVLEALALPLVSVLGDAVASWLAPLPERADVELRTRQSIADVTEDGDGFSVRFKDGTALVAGLVVVGVGVVPNTEWLQASGLEVRNGVVVNDTLWATDRVAAIGDVARFTWRHGPFTEEVRIEHWQCAADHAVVLGTALVSGSDSPIELVPYFWSDQYGKKIQMLGHPAPTDDVTKVLGDDERWLALYSRDDIVTGLVSLSHPRALMLSLPLVAGHAVKGEAFAQAPWET